MKKEYWTSIINSISNWLKLLALIVLVAEVIILVAMHKTPVENPICQWYPIIMIFLLVIVITAVFFDRYLDRRSKNLTVKVEQKELTINTAKTYLSSIKETSDKYTNSILGYSFVLPKGKDWHEPKEISFSEYISQILLIEEINEEYLKALVARNQFGNLLYQSNILELQYGSDIVIKLDEQTTTDAIEHHIKKTQELKALDDIELSEEQITKLRADLNQHEEFEELGFSVKLNVLTLDKNNLDVNFVDLGLPNLFLSLSTGSKEPLDTISANENSILWTTNGEFKNVLIEDKRYNSMSIYRMYQLVQNDKYIYLCTIQWSPQSQAAVFTWDKLKLMFESFQIKK